MTHEMTIINRPDVELSFPIFSLKEVVRRMDELDMLTNGTAPRLDAELFSDFEYSLLGDVDPVRDFADSIRGVIRHERLSLGAPEGGIPRWKIYGTNDGWIVTPMEISHSLSSWVQAGAPFDEESPKWQTWIRFLLLAMANYGFIVT